MTTASTQRSRLRATSATGSRRPSATSGCSDTTWPPSSRTAISNVVRVRSDGLSNSIATCRPSSALAVGAAGPERRSDFRRAASSRQRSRSCASKSRIERKFRAMVAVFIASPHEAVRRRCGGVARSRSVVRVDADVVGARDRTSRRSTTTGRRRDRPRRDVGALQVLGRLRRRLVVRPAVLEQHRRSDRDGRPRQLERDAGAPGDRDQAAPVRIAAVDRRLDERRVGDRLGRAPRVRVDAAPVTLTVTSFVAPSPPRTMPSASSRQTAFSARAKRS